MFDNSLTLTRFLLRRERVGSPVWIGVLVLVLVAVLMVFGVGIDQESRLAIGELMSVPYLVVMVGPGFGMDNFTVGAFNSVMMTLYAAITVGIMNILLIVRHTRADEEKGRYEVVRSLPVGRLANLNAALITAVIINVVLAVVTALGMFGAGVVASAALGDYSINFAGSLLWGATLGGTGLVFAAITALFSQLSSNSGGAMGYSFGAMLVFFMMRSVGDVNADLEILSLVNPLGLSVRTQAYVGNYWQPVLIMLGMAVAFAVIAYVLNVKRDIEQGIIPARKGRANGGALLGTSFGLTVRLSRTMFIICIAFVLTLGIAYGSMFGQIDTFIAQNEMYQMLVLGRFELDLSSLYHYCDEEVGAALSRLVFYETGITLNQMIAATFGMMMALMGMIVPLLLVLKVKSEETNIRSELILATPVCRNKYLTGYVIIAVAGSVIVQLASGFGLFAAGASVLYDPAELPLGTLLSAQLVFLPAMWVLIGFTVLLIGLKPKLSGVIWGYFGFAFLISIVGRMPVLPDWVPYTTPFGFIPQLPVDEVNFVTLGILTATATALTVLGFVFYNKRDINAVTH